VPNTELRSPVSTFQQDSRPSATMPTAAADLRARIDSTRLLQGGRELLIAHAGEEYRLRLTRNDKLILTK